MAAMRHLLWGVQSSGGLSHGPANTLGTAFQPGVPQGQARARPECHFPLPNQLLCFPLQALFSLPDLLLCFLHPALSAAVSVPPPNQPADPHRGCPCIFCMHAVGQPPVDWDFMLQRGSIPVHCNGSSMPRGGFSCG